MLEMNADVKLDVRFLYSTCWISIFCLIHLKVEEDM